MEGNAASAHQAAMRAREKLKHRIGFILLQRVVSFVLSIAVAVIMAMTLARYSSTRNVSFNSQAAWPTRTVLWPTIMLFVISTAISLLYIAIMISYCMSSARAKKISTTTSLFSVVLGLMRFAAWLVAAALYKIGQRSGRDIWSWSCNAAEKLPVTIYTVVRLDLICDANDTSFHLTYISAILEAFGVAVWVWISRRYTSKRAIAERRAL